MTPHEILFRLEVHILNRSESAKRGEIKTTAKSQQEQRALNQGMAMAYLDVQDFLKTNGVHMSVKR